MRRGWDALNKNFNSPVRYIHAITVYIGFQGKNRDYSTVKISAPPSAM